MKRHHLISSLLLLAGLSGPALAEDQFPLAIATADYPHIRAVLDGTVHIPECRISYSTYSLADLTARLENGSAGDVIEVDLTTYLQRFATEPKHDWTLVPVFLLRQFPDKPEAELEAEFTQTRVFPIRTALAVRAELVHANPWLPEALFRAFGDAKNQALEAGLMPLPLGARTEEVMGKNFWSYGVKDNPKSLHALTALKVEDLFSGETLSLLDDAGGKKK